MNKIINTPLNVMIKKNRFAIICVSLFFSLYILIGLFVYQDYGVSPDEPTTYLRGSLNYQRITGVISQKEFMAQCKSEDFCYYPPLFDMVLYRLARTGDSRSIYLTRHLFTFLYFAFSVFVFFLIGKKIFKDWKIGLLAALFLIVSPRIFAHSFYNPKDIPFLSAYIISIYTMLLFLENKNIPSAILHGLATGIVCSIRIPGIVIFLITFIFLMIDLFLSPNSWKNRFKTLIPLFIFLLSACSIIVISFPVLYSNPIHNYLTSFNIMKQYPWKNYHLYLGKDIKNQIPWHYSIVWFAISSPIFYQLLFIWGSAVLIYLSIKEKALSNLIKYRDYYLVASCGILPILMVIVLRSVIYQDNRQMYFCYPPLLLISVYGFTQLINRIKINTHLKQILIGLLLLVGLAYPIYFMIRYHPYQNVYFNILAGSKISVIKQRFGLDTWRLSNKQGLEYILKTDPRNKITISIFEQYYSKKSSIASTLILSENQLNRITMSNQSPDYIIDTYRYMRKFDLPGSVYYSIKVGDTDILTVYKMDWSK